MLGEQIVKSIKNWWVLLIIGILYILAGIYFLVNPGITFVTLALLFSIILIVDGVSSIFFSYQSRKQLEGWGWGVAAGALYLLIGIALLRNQGAAQSTLILLFAFTLMLRGGMTFALSLEMNRMKMGNWIWVLLLGIATIALSVALILNPGFAVALIVTLLAISFLLMGSGLVAASLSLRRVKMQAKELKEHAGEKLQELHQKLASFSEEDGEKAAAFIRELREDLKNAVRGISKA